MSIRIQTRILLLLAILAVLFLGVLSLNWLHQRNRMYSMLESRETEKAVLLKRVTALMSHSLKTFAYDYTYWDEMCGFVDSGDPEWALLNIDEALETYDAQVAWVYRKNLTCLYTTTTLEAEALDELPLSSGQLDSLISRSAFSHFFVRHPVGLLEIYGAPVQPSEDSLRKSEPQGFMFVSRLWSPQHLGDLGQLVDGSPWLSAITDTSKILCHDLAEFTTANTVTLAGWDGRPVVHLNVIYSNPTLLASYTEARSNFLAGIAFVVLLMLVSSLLLFRTVTAPLERISRSLREQDPRLIEDLKRCKTEFADVASLILEFFQQKHALQTEIEQRRETEAALRSKESLLQATIESTGDGILIVDRDGKVSRSNRRFAELWNISDELIGEQNDQRLLDFILEQLVDPQAFLDKVQKLYACGEEDFDTLLFKDGRIYDRYSFPLMLNGGIAGRVWNFRDVTQNKRAEIELRRSNHLLAALIQTAPLPIWTIDVTGRVDSIWNPAAEQMLGWRQVDVQGKLDPTIAEGQNDAVRSSLDSLQTGKPVCDLEVQAHTRDGGILIASYNRMPLYDAEGIVAGAVVIMMDLTERKLAEQAMRESEERFRNLSDSAPVLIWMAGMDRHCYYFNRTWRNFTGRSLQNEYGKGWLEGVHPDDRAACLDTYRAAFTAQRPFTTEFRLRHMDGTYHFLMDTGVPRFGVDGRFTGFIGTSTDITDWKASEDALRASEERFRTVFETIPDAIFLKNRDREYTYANPVAARYLGLSTARLIGRTDDDLIPGPEAETIRESDLRVLAGESIQIELSHVVDNTTLTLHVLKVPLRDRDGVITGICSAVRDITERRKMEETLAAERQLFVGGPTVVFKWRETENTPVAYVSPNVRHQFGYTPEMLTDGSINYEDLIHPDDLSRLRNELNQQLKIGSPYYDLEYRLRHADGSYRWVYDFTVPNHTDENGVRYHHGYIVDITERKQSARALLDQALRYRAITDATPYAMVISRLDDGTVLYANDRFCRLFGVEAGDLPHLRRGDFLRDPVAEEKALRQLRRCGYIEDLEIDTTCPDGRVLRQRVAGRIFEFEGITAALTVMQPLMEVPDPPRAAVPEPRGSMSHHLEMLNRDIRDMLTSVGGNVQRSAADQRAKKL